mmetsp:Transcript_49579/g.106123  ORF Transcript_49579/g.106123 Transcript_49579/m.106123 type:complete len:278 (+) Transcript_49579:811-1644(+)
MQTRSRPESVKSARDRLRRCPESRPKSRRARIPLQLRRHGCGASGASPPPSLRASRTANPQCRPACNSSDNRRNAGSSNSNSGLARCNTHWLCNHPQPKRTLSRQCQWPPSAATCECASPTLHSSIAPHLRPVRQGRTCCYNLPTKALSGSIACPRRCSTVYFCSPLQPLSNVQLHPLAVQTRPPGCPTPCNSRAYRPGPPGRRCAACKSCGNWPNTCSFHSRSRPLAHSTESCYNSRRLCRKTVGALLSSPQSVLSWTCWPMWRSGEARPACTGGK